MTSLIQDPLLWILLVVLIAAVFAVLSARRTNMALRRKNNDLHNEYESGKSQLERVSRDYTTLYNRQAGELAEVRHGAEEDLKQILKSAMRTLQVLADQQQGIIEKAQMKYGEDTEILADLMQINHANGQFGRRAQGVAVLCGGWLGRRETIASVYDVARSAQGRIKQFGRVRINAQVNVSVVSKAVEPVAVVLAELLANATNFSAPDTFVDVNIQAVSKGVCLIVDDAGLGISDEEKERAKAMLDPQGPVAITALGNPPRFGFAVSGDLAARYGFKVSVDSVSPYGGVRAVILLPENLLTNDVPEPAPQAAAQGAVREQAPAQQPAPAPAAPQSQAPDTMAVPAPVRVIGTTVGGLPKRRRRAVESVPPMAVASSGDEQEAAQDSQVTASRVAAFARGTALGRETTTTEGPQDQ
ncbi:ATP-binding protein [Streptomyces avermitilis]|uniref:ATP-binding protein n=1 Tax=Streptomyces avermitilis TaxID=33903 RepID=UPI0033FCBE84